MLTFRLIPFLYELTTSVDFMPDNGAISCVCSILGFNKFFPVIFKLTFSLNFLPITKSMVAKPFSIISLLKRLSLLSKS